METLRSKTTIEHRFGSAMRFYNEVCKRGFQAEISRATGVDTSNLSSIIRSDKGASEQVRRDIFEAAIAIASKQKAELYIHSYESFLQLGQLILEGVPGEEALELAKAGVKKHVYQHLLRHSFGTTAAIAGMPMAAVQDIMGHADPETTKVYQNLAAFFFGTKKPGSQ